MASLIEYSLMNSLKTDNLIINSIICILIPIIISYIHNTDFIQILKNYIDNDYIHIIEYEYYNFPRYNYHENKPIYDAIMYYISTVKVKSRFTNINTLYIKGMDNVRTQSEKLKQNTVISMPVCQEYTCIKDNIYIKINKRTVEREKTIIITTKVKINIKVKNTSSFFDKKEIIDNFLDFILNSYIQYIKKKELLNNKQYFYYQYMNENTIMYNQIELHNSKTFDKLFIPNKQEIIYLLNNLENTENKLGFMLYGPPGSGKSSMIKAISNYTKRHIIYLNLNNIKTNRDFMSIMNLDEYTINNTQYIIPFNKKIFVFEDIDCMSDIIKIRNQENIIINDDIKDNEKEKKKKEDELDKLNLSSILNILDGIIETPNRLIIMTTNHLDVLDPALIRPGRIDKIIHLDYIKLDELILMIQSFYKNILTIDEINILTNCQLKYTPAQIEQLCIQNITIDKLLTHFK